jgi:hypothetical protein
VLAHLAVNGFLPAAAASSLRRWTTHDTRPDITVLLDTTPNPAPNAGRRWGRDATSVRLTL